MIPIVLRVFGHIERLNEQRMGRRVLMAEHVQDECEVGRDLVGCIV